jgi:hypothetical protein
MMNNDDVNSLEDCHQDSESSDNNCYADMGFMFEGAQSGAVQQFTWSLNLAESSCGANKLADRLEMVKRIEAKLKTKNSTKRNGIITDADHRC